MIPLEPSQEGQEVQEFHGHHEGQQVNNVMSINNIRISRESLLWTYPNPLLPNLLGFDTELEFCSLP